MKKSEIYYLAQMAVVNSLSIIGEKKLEILKELMDKEALAKWSEEKEAKENA